MISGELLNSMVSLLLLCLLVGLLTWGISLQRRAKQLQRQLQVFESDGSHARSVRRSAEIELAQAKKEADEIIGAAQAELEQSHRIADKELRSAREKAAEIIQSAEFELKGPRETASQIIDRAEKELSNARQQASEIAAIADKELRSAREKAAEIIQSAEREVGELRAQINSLRVQESAASNELKQLNEQLLLKAEDAQLLEVGFYQPVYGFEDLAEYQEAIAKIKDEQKSMLRSISGKAWLGREDFDPAKDSPASIATETVSYNGSDAQGEKLLMKVQQLMLKAFNGECDAFVARVSYRNFSTMEKRIRSAFEQIDRIGRMWHCRLSERYLENRIEELRLVYEFAELQEKIKREQAAIREQMREEERAAREAERAKKRLEDERAEYEQQLSVEKDKEKIRELQRIIEEISGKERAISLAQVTRAGHVYILSNVGSFGDNVFKIGMTRREDPKDRVRELGDASVPFPFDVHAMIATKDAPALEKALHNHFSQRRVNLENERKEFFRLSIQEIRDELQRLKDSLGIESEIRLSLLAEAKEYRQSEARRSYLIPSESVS